MTDSIDASKWDAAAAAVGGGYFHCHAEALYDAACRRTEPAFIKALDETGRCVALTTGTISRPRLWPFRRYCDQARLLSLPVLARSADVSLAAVMEAIEEHLRRSGVFRVHVCAYDSPDDGELLRSLGYKVSPRWEFLVDLRCGQEELWGAFPCERRTDIRKAEKQGVVTKLQNSPEALELVFSFFQQSHQRRGRSLQPVHDWSLEARQRRLESGRTDIFVSYQRDKAVGAALFGVFNGKSYYHLSGSSQEGLKCCAPAHLLWTAIRWYKGQGARCLNLGAALEDQQGLYRFKRDFGARIVPAPSGAKVISGLGATLHRLQRLARGPGRRLEQAT